LSGYLNGSLDVGVLSALVTARQQNHRDPASAHEIHPITGAVINPQLRYALP